MKSEFMQQTHHRNRATSQNVDYEEISTIVRDSSVVYYEACRCFRLVIYHE
jgi:hypothetical protein